MRSLLKFLVSPAFLLAAAAVLVGVSYSFLKAPGIPTRDESFEPDRYMLPQAPITKLSIKTVREADKLLDPAELVLGVSIGKEARAYPINMMNHEPARKVLNDTLAGKPIIASWCDSAHNALVYSREVDGTTLTFGIAGQLWKGSLLMYDEQTWTRWSHHLGLAKLGPLKDKTLEPVPSMLTDWKSWKGLHPDGTVAIFDSASLQYVKGLYDDVDQFVLGIISNGHARSWSFDTLRREQTINDSWQGKPVVAIFDLVSGTARLYSREIGGRELTFASARSEPTDQETGTTWDRLSGKAVTGPLSGKQLAPMPAFVSSRRTWQEFHAPRRK